MKTNTERVVIKMGTNVLVSPTGEILLASINSLADQVVELSKQGIQPVLVSSGAVACGNGSTKAVTTLEQQVAAMVGQPKLMLHWRDAFKRYGLMVGQVLGTHADFRRPSTLAALAEAIERGIIPVINENDPVSEEELEAFKQHGDNDALSAIVAIGIKADRLIILSDVDGLFLENPKTTSGQKRIAVVREITSEIRALVIRLDSDRPSGMEAKINAFEVAMSAGITGHLAAGNKPDVLLDIMAGADASTIFQSPGTSV